MSEDQSDSGGKPVVPDTPEFQALLRNLSLAPPGTEIADSAIDQSTPLSRHVAGRLPHFTLHAPRQGKVDVNWLIASTRRALRAAGHVDTYEAARLVLSLFVFHARRQATPVSAFSSFIQAIKPCVVNQYFVTPAPAPTEVAARIGPFTIGPLDVERLAYQLRSADAEIKEDPPVPHSFTIARDGVTLPILPANLPTRMGVRTDLLGPDAREIALVVVDDYFSELAREMFERFWRELRDVQLLTTTLGAPFLDGRFFRERAHGSKLVSVFWKFGNAGWVKSQGQGWAVDVGPMAAIAQKEAEVRELIHGRDVSEFSHVVNVFGQLIVRGREHEIDGRIDEAFLSHMIALDMVFGVKGESTRSVAERVATVTSEGRSEAAKQRKKRLQVLYDVRSGYVHQGQSCDEPLLSEVKDFCRDVGLALLRVAALPASERPRTIDQWLTRLDIVWKSWEGDVRVGDSDLTLLGIARSTPAKSE